jgi:mannitol-specific phosphotransferase system IIC component
MSNFTPAATGTGARARIQRFGGYLSGMVMPNIGAFIAFGFITALFIPDGWTPNADLAEMVGPMIVVLIPTLVAYTGGRMVHGQRGAVIGAVATFGAVVAGADPVSLEDGTSVLPFGGQVMILGAFVLGPLAAYLLKVFDNLVAGKVKAGFEMLIDNFSIGILGGLLAIFGYKVIEPVVGWITDRLGDGVESLVENSLLPVASVIIEPAKVLFLNNAINHGVLTPLGAAEVQEQGKSILFMLEANPGPGAGLLLAYLFFGPRSLRPTVPAALIIHFFGGIHEVYFPYVLMKPKMILATIAGGASGIAIFQAFDVGLTGPAAPGSFIAFMGVTAKGDYFGVVLGIAVSAAVAFFVAGALFGFGRNSDDDSGQTDVELTKAEESVAATKAQGKGAVPAPSAPVANRNEPQEA